MSYLLDTNVLSELRKPRCDEGVSSWLASVEDQRLYLSVLVLGEVRQRIERIRGRDPKAARAIETWLQRLRTEYANRLLPVTSEIADEWGRLNARDPLPATDALLAATARVHQLVVVTRNEADFSRMGVRLLNPFRG